MFKIDDLVIDIAGYEARVAEHEIELTHPELELLPFLGRNRAGIHA